MTQNVIGIAAAAAAIVIRAATASAQAPAAAAAAPFPPPAVKIQAGDAPNYAFDITKAMVYAPLILTPAYPDLVARFSLSTSAIAEHQPVIVIATITNQGKVDVTDRSLPALVSGVTL